MYRLIKMNMILVAIACTGNLAIHAAEISISSDSEPEKETTEAEVEFEDIQPASLTLASEYDFDETESDTSEEAECATGNCDGGCEAGCGCCNKCEEPWTLFQETCRGFQLGGWFSGGITYNADDPTTSFNGPVTFNDRNEGQLNQGWFFIDRPIDTEGCGWDIGGHIDFVWGTDARFTQSVGLEDNWSSERFYQLAMPQAYVEIGYNDLSLKAGHFFTIIGYEVVPAPQNFFYSHAYTMQYAEPFTHTGLLASYKYSDQWSFTGGVHYGWDLFENDLDSASFLGGVTWTSCDENTSVAFAVTSGDDSNSIASVSNRTMYSVVLSHNFCENWTYVLQHDNGWQEDGNGAGINAEWYGINQYLFYTINDCWKAGLRYEWFRDDDGTRVSALGIGNPATGAGNTFQGNFHELTAGLNWTPTANLTLRPELRWDWSDSTTGLPFDDGTKDSQFLAAFDLIFTY